MEDVFARPVSDTTFGALTLAEVRGRAEKLQAAVGWGTTPRVRAGADAWRDLADAMEAAGVPTVADLGDDAARRARDLGVLPPAGGFL